MASFGFIGGSYTAWSTRLEAQVSMNLYPVSDEAHPKSYQEPGGRMALYGTPGISVFLTLPKSPIRGIWTGIAGAAYVGDRCLVVAGDTLYDVFTGGTYAALGAVETDSAPVDFMVNGGQVGIVSNGHFFIYDGTSVQRINYSNGAGTCSTSGTAVTRLTGSSFDATYVPNQILINGVYYTVSAVADGDHLTLSSSAGTQTNVLYTQFSTNPVLAASGSFLDTYFMVNQPGTKLFNISNNNDGTQFAPIDVAAKEGFPDNLIKVLADHEEVWLFGTETTEVWRNTGAATFPLERDAGAFIQIGIRAKQSAVSFAGGVGWIGADNLGGPVAYFAQGYQPERVSTYAVEQAWAAYGDTSDAISYTYTEFGHVFWVINFPGGNATWVYDRTERLWHQRGWWNAATSTIDRQRQAFHGQVFGKHLVGDWQNGKIYVMSTSTYEDDGVDIHAIRACGDPPAEDEWTYYKQFRLDAENSGALNPTLDYSIDGGVTFRNPRTTTSQVAGRLSVYDWRRLGRSRARVWRITITARVKRALLNAYTK